MTGTAALNVLAEVWRFLGRSKWGLLWDVGVLCWCKISSILAFGSLHPKEQLLELREFFKVFCLLSKQGVLLWYGWLRVSSDDICPVDFQNIKYLFQNSVRQAKLGVTSVLSSPHLSPQYTWERCPDVTTSDTVVTSPHQGYKVLFHIDISQPCCNTTALMIQDPL